MHASTLRTFAIGNNNEDFLEEIYTSVGLTYFTLRQRVKERGERKNTIFCIEMKGCIIISCALNSQTAYLLKYSRKPIWLGLAS
jgi:hypothetical protein